MGLKVILAFVIGWAIAQLSKLVILLIKTKCKVGAKDIINTIVKSGGMPSGHAASFTAVVLSIGRIEGFDSVIFALAACSLVIVLYDSVNVRYAVGEQGKVLNKLSGKAMRVVEGHTIPQAIVGVLIGILSSFLAFYF